MPQKNEVAKATKILNFHGEQIQTKLKDGMELNLSKFGRHDSEIALLTEDGTKVAFPPYVEHGRSRFGYDCNIGILARQCSNRNCGKWFAIARLLPDGSWDQFCDTEDVHFDGTRFRSYCTPCYNGKKAEKAEKAENHAGNAKTESKPKSGKSCNDGKKKKSIYMFLDHYKYLQKLAIDREVSIGDVLAEIISKYRKE